MISLKRKLSLLPAILLCLAGHLSFAQQPIKIPTPKGDIAAILEKPDLQQGETCPVVILMHGFTANKDGAIQTGMAKSLLKEGIASLRFDFNGHGESYGKFEDMTVPSEIEDAKTVYRYLREQPWCGKIALLGHSQGGVVASMTAGELGKEKVDAVVLFAPAAVLREDCIRGNTMGTTYDPENPPSQGVPLPMGGLTLGAEYIRTAFDLPIYETAALYDGPACILHGTGDRIVPYTYGQRFHAIWKGSEYYQIEGEDHSFTKELPTAVAIATAYLSKTLKPKTQTDMSERKNLGKKMHFVPNPVLIIGTYDADGVPNAMNAAWGGRSGMNKVTICLSRHKTTDNIIAKKCFTVSFADVAHVVEADYVGIVSGKAVPDKVAKAGLHAEKAENVDAPVFSEFPLTLECKLVSFEDDGNGGLVTGEVVGVSADPRILDEDGDVDLSLMRPIIYDAEGNYYRVVGDIVGKAFSDGKKLNK